LQKEVAQLAQEISRIATQTQFNGKTLLDGSFGTGSFQVGAYAGQTISFGIGNAQASAIVPILSRQYPRGRSPGRGRGCNGRQRCGCSDLTVSSDWGGCVTVGADNTAKAIAAG